MKGSVSATDMLEHTQARGRILRDENLRQSGCRSRRSASSRRGVNGGHDRPAHSHRHTSIKLSGPEGVSGDPQTFRAHGRMVEIIADPAAPAAWYRGFFKACQRWRHAVGTVTHDEKVTDDHDGRAAAGHLAVIRPAGRNLKSSSAS